MSIGLSKEVAGTFLSSGKPWGVVSSVFGDHFADQTKSGFRLSTTQRNFHAFKKQYDYYAKKRRVRDRDPLPDGVTSWRAEMD
jgi:hypothetical protein